MLNSQAHFFRLKVIKALLLRVIAVLKIVLFELGVSACGYRHIWEGCL